jgi:uncharacterized membrane protein
MICNGAILFSINKSLVKKDITIGKDQKSNSYRDFINRSYTKIKPADGGLKSVINVLSKVLDQNKMLTFDRKNYIFSKILFSTYPFWILDYKRNKATPAAVGLYLGLMPHRIEQFAQLRIIQKVKFAIGFQIISFVSFLMPSVVFFKYKEQIYTWAKKVF